MSASGREYTTLESPVKTDAGPGHPSCQHWLLSHPYRQGTDDRPHGMEGTARARRASLD